MLKKFFPSLSHSASDYESKNYNGRSSSSSGFSGSSSERIYASDATTMRRHSFSNPFPHLYVDEDSRISENGDMSIDPFDGSINLRRQKTAPAGIHKVASLSKLGPKVPKSVHFDSSALSVRSLPIQLNAPNIEDESLNSKETRDESIESGQRSLSSFYCDSEGSKDKESLEFNSMKEYRSFENEKQKMVSLFLEEGDEEGSRESPSESFSQDCSVLNNCVEPFYHDNPKRADSKVSVATEFFDQSIDDRRQHTQRNHRDSKSENSLNEAGKDECIHSKDFCCSKRNTARSHGHNEDAKIMPSKPSKEAKNKKTSLRAQKKLVHEKVISKGSNLNEGEEQDMRPLQEKMPRDQASFAAKNHDAYNNNNMERHLDSSSYDQQEIREPELKEYTEGSTSGSEKARQSLTRLFKLDQQNLQSSNFESRKNEGKKEELRRKLSEQELKIAYLNSTNDKLLQKFSELLKDHQRLKNERGILISKLDNVESKADLLIKELQISRAEKDALLSNFDNAQLKADILVKDLEILRAEKDVLQSNYDNAQSKADLAIKDHEILIAEKEKAKEKSMDQDSEIEKLKRQMEEWKNKSEKDKEEIVALKKKVETYTVHMEEASSQINEELSYRNELESQIQRLTKDSMIANEKSKESLKALQSRFDLAQCHLKDKVTRLSEVTLECHGLQEKLDKKKDELSALGSKIMILEKEQNDKHKENEYLTKSNLQLYKTLSIIRENVPKLLSEVRQVKRTSAEYRISNEILLEATKILLCSVHTSFKPIIKEGSDNDFISLLNQFKEMKKLAIGDGETINYLYYFIDHSVRDLVRQYLNNEQLLETEIRNRNDGYQKMLSKLVNMMELKFKNSQHGEHETHRNQLIRDRQSVKKMKKTKRAGLISKTPNINPGN